jgi:hypothetical protein
MSSEVKMSSPDEMQDSRDLMTSIVMLFKSAGDFAYSIPNGEASELYIGKDQGDPRIKVGTPQAQVLLFSALNFTLRYFVTLEHDMPGSTLEDCVKKIASDISVALKDIEVREEKVDLKGDMKKCIEQIRSAKLH